MSSDRAAELVDELAVELVDELIDELVDGLRLDCWFGLVDAVLLAAVLLRLV